MTLSARLLLDLRGVEQSGHDRRRANANRDARLYELVPPFLFGAFVASVAHPAFSMASTAGLEAA